MPPHLPLAARAALLALGLCACTRAPAAPAAPPPPAPTGPAPLFGYWGLNGRLSPAGLADARARLGAEVVHTASRSPGYVLHTLLPLVQAAGMKLSLRMTGDHPHYRTTAGDFDLAAWKRALAPWAPHADALAPYIADGTLVAHMLLDDIHNFPGRDPTAAELDEMARHAKAMMPGLAVFVRERASEMPVPESGRYEHLDALVNQYRVRLGPVEDWSREQSDRAAALGLRVICGINIANGGDGSSAQPGWRQGRHAMSADEIDRYGAILATDARCAMVLAWEYDAEERWSDGSIGAAYFDRPENTAALQRLAARATGRPGAPLTREGRPARR